MAHITGLYRRQSSSIYMETAYPILRHSLYMETAYPILSMFSLLFLHFFLYGCNIFAWRKARINYSFIFELSPTKELKYRDVFLICTTSMTVVVGVMFVHLFLLTKGYSYTQVQAIPGLLLLVISSTSWHDNLKKEDQVFNFPLMCRRFYYYLCAPSTSSTNQVAVVFFVW